MRLGRVISRVRIARQLSWSIFSGYRTRLTPLWSVNMIELLETTEKWSDSNRSRPRGNKVQHHVNQNINTSCVWRLSQSWRSRNTIFVHALSIRTSLFCRNGTGKGLPKLRLHVCSNYFGHTISAERKLFFLSDPKTIIIFYTTRKPRHPAIVYLLSFIEGRTNRPISFRSILNATASLRWSVTSAESDFRVVGGDITNLIMKCDNVCGRPE